MQITNEVVKIEAARYQEENTVFMSNKKPMIITLSIVAILIVAVVLVFLHPAFGVQPKGERLKRMQASPNYQNGAFVNSESTQQFTSDKSFGTMLWENLQERRISHSAQRIPHHAVPAVKTDLRTLDASVNQLVWFGHSSYLLFLGGKTFLIDPILSIEFPSSVMLHPFSGTDIYTPADLPDIDYLIITHDHWDHLDYGTLRQLLGRVEQVVCPLGVGAHLERWGYQNIIEMDWYETSTPADDVRITCLPTRHFSGRLLQRNPTLWASFMIEADKTVYVGGDGGYGKHFARIGELFPQIDLALLENGQYNSHWAQIHTLPEEMPAAIRDLHAKQNVPVHNSKFALAQHPWNEPMQYMQHLAEQDSTLHIQLPMIGQPIVIK